MPVTQDNRILSIATPLGKDYLLIDSIAGTEEMSRLFRFTLDLRHEEANETGPPTEVKGEDLLGKSVTVTVTQPDETVRYFNGIVNRISQGNRHKSFTYYSIEVVPHLWLLTQIRQSKIFQNKSVPDILRDVLGRIEFKIELQGNYQPRNYCVQYRESDFDFISRLMEEEGIFYFFEHTDKGHKMIIADTPTSHRDCPGKSDIEFAEENAPEEFFVASVTRLALDYQLHTGKVAFWDHKFELPTNKLDANKPSRFSVGGNQQLEVYEYPGFYAQRFDGVDKGGGEQGGELQKIFADKDRKAQVSVDVLDSQYKTFNGAGDCSSMTPGYRFKLKGHGLQAFNSQYVLTSVEHSAKQSPDYASESEVTGPYTNKFTCIPHGSGAPPFRPQPTTEKPFVQGSQTATVVGPAGEEIFTDKYGRVKVQFHWDRHGKVDAGSSCWVRVAQPHSGKQWGTMFIPRIGMEVVINFMEGDPDQPIIVGSVYNAENMPPYPLPQEKTKSTIKTNSSPGGGGFNELRFEDKAGSEQIFIHAQKDEDIRVNNDCMETIGNKRHLTVASDQIESVGGNKHLQVSGNQAEKIGGSSSLNVGGDQQEKIGMKHAVDAGMEIHLKAGMKVVIEAGVQLTLKGPGGFIDINPAGVTVQGTMVLINSGGAAGAGSGCSPDSPEKAKEADKAQSGQKVAPPQAPPPPPAPPDYTIAATAARERAQNPSAPSVQQAIQQMLQALPPPPPLPAIPPVPVPDIEAAIAAAQSAVQSLAQDAQAMVQEAVEQVANSPVLASVMDKVNEVKAKVDEVKAKAQEKIDQAKAVAAEAKQAAQEKIAEVKAKVAEAKAQVEAAKAKVEEARQQVEQARETLNQAVDAVKGLGNEAAGLAQAAQDALPFG